MARNVSWWTLSFSVLAFGLLVGVHYLALKVERVASYQMPFNWPWLGLVIFLVFVLYLVIVKFLSLPNRNVKVPVQEVYKK